MNDLPPTQSSKFDEHIEEEEEQNDHGKLTPIRLKRRRHDCEVESSANIDVEYLNMEYRNSLLVDKYKEQHELLKKSKKKEIDQAKEILELKKNEIKLLEKIHKLELKYFLF